jgi:HK97 family phage prohead protease
MIELQGYIVLWDDVGEIDGTPETFTKFAFMDFLAGPKARFVRLHRDHYEPVAIAWCRDGSLSLWEDNAGLAFSARLDGPGGLSLVSDVARGGYWGMSPGWDRVQSRLEDGVRTTSKASLREASVTDNPAFAQAAIWLSTTDFYDSPAHVRQQRGWWARRDDSWRVRRPKAARAAAPKPARTAASLAPVALRASGVMPAWPIDGQFICHRNFTQWARQAGVFGMVGRPEGGMRK